MADPVMELAWNGGRMAVQWLSTKLRPKPDAIPTPQPILAPPVFQPPEFTNVTLPTLPAAPTIEAIPGPMPSDALRGSGVNLSRLDSLSPQPVIEMPKSVPANGQISYAADVADGIACAACTKDHLATMAGAAKALTHTTDPTMQRYQLARIAGEIAALEQYDWTPEKIAATPADKLRPVEAVQPAVRQLQAQLATPSDIALAWGALDECIRFAEGRPTDRDRSEIAQRLQDIDERMNYLERVTLAPEHTANLDPAVVDQTREALRLTRHTLEQGDPFALATLKTASAQLSQAAVALTPPVDSATAQQLATHIQQTQRQFYRAFFNLERRSV